MTMLSYHGEQSLKGAAIARMREHREQDRLAQDYGYWAAGRGCAVGCLVADAARGDFAEMGFVLRGRYEPLFGLPSELAHLEEFVFECSSPDYARTWPERFLEAIPVGVEVDRTECQDRLRRFSERRPPTTPERRRFSEAVGDDLLAWLRSLAAEGDREPACGQRVVA